MPSGLADGLALKESRYAEIPAIRPKDPFWSGPIGSPDRRGTRPGRFGWVKYRSGTLSHLQDRCHVTTVSSSGAGIGAVAKPHPAQPCGTSRRLLVEVEDDVPRTRRSSQPHQPGAAGGRGFGCPGRARSRRGSRRNRRCGDRGSTTGRSGRDAVARWRCAMTSARGWSTCWTDEDAWVYERAHSAASRNKALQHRNAA